MVPSEEIYSRLTPILQDVFDDPDLIATPGLSAKDVSEWDSLSHVRLMLTVEKAFGVKFTASEVGKLKNLGDLALLIEKKTS